LLSYGPKQQKVWRGRKGRIEAMNLRRGDEAILIQKIYRGYICRKR